MTAYLVRLWLFASLLGTGSSAMGSSPPGQLITPHVIHDFAQQHASGQTPAELEALLTSIAPNPEVLRLIQKPAEKLPWWRYQSIFLTPKRIALGVQFWNEHEASLTRAEEQYGVPPEIILGILGAESNYGQDMSRFSVLEALATLAFYYPPRATFFAKELEMFLKLATQEKWDLKSIKGSYAGAMGMAQFIPSAYQSLAIDFDGDGHRDLFNHPDDAIGSIANYLQKSGWERNGPIVWPVHNPSRIPASPNEKPHQTLLTWQKKGLQWSSHAHFKAPGFEKVSLNRAPDLSRKAALLSFEQKENLTDWIGFTNFYVITRYNHSALYAMAVTQLAAYIKEQWNSEHRKTRREFAKNS